PRAPRLAAVHRDDGALVARQQDDVGVVRVDPRTLVVVAAWGATQRVPSLSAVDRLPCNDGRHDDDVGVLRVDGGYGEVAPADTPRRTRVGRDLRPILTRVVRAIDA